MKNLPIVQGRKLCAFRDNSYNFLQIQRPENKSAEGEWLCQDKKMNKLCGNSTSSSNLDVYCIPDTSKCPVTSFKYAADGSIEVQTDPSKDSPLLDLVLSEGGPPCVNHRTQFNA